MEMRDGLILGLIAGMFAGALLYKHNATAKEFINKSEQAVKKEIKNMAKDKE